MKQLSDIDVSGKRVFVRADLDIPMPSDERLTQNAEVEQETRLKNLKGTVDYLFTRGVGKVIIAGHIGRPAPTTSTIAKGAQQNSQDEYSLESTIARALDDRPQYYDESLSTAKIRGKLERILGRSVIFAENFGQSVNENLELFENLRFWPGENENDLEFAKQLAQRADVYVNEAFGNSHREHASMVSLPSLLPHAAGLHLELEVATLTAILKSPQKPFVAIVGGDKIETKIPVIENLAKLADYVLVGGLLPVEIARLQSLERSNGGQAKQNLKFAPNVLVAKLDELGKDLSEESANGFAQTIKGAKTVVWNGPLGLFEEDFEGGTMLIAGAIVQSGAYSVVGGGETTAFLQSHSLVDKFSFVSSGGGAMLSFLSGKELPALKALE